MLHHIYRSNIGVLGHGQHAFQRYSSSFKPTRGGAQLPTSNVISRLIHQPQDASRSLCWSAIINPINCLSPSVTARYKSATLDKPQCSHPGCTNKVNGRSLLCYTHQYPCAIDGCDSRARKAGGYCQVHAKEYDQSAHKIMLSQFKRCKDDGCEKHAQAGEYCVKHAKVHDEEAYYKLLEDRSCEVDGCMKQEKVGGYCTKHAKERDKEAYDRIRSDRSCNVEGCIIPAVTDGYCSKHAQQYAQKHIGSILIM